MSRDDHHEDFEEEDLLEQPSILNPRIYEGNWQESNPSGFDAVIIHLNGGVQADLDWKKEKELARQAIEAGYAILWHMNLGLFDDLVHPVTNQSQFLSLTLGLEHFRDSLWKEFKAHTVGIALYQGSADFSHCFRWDELQEQNFRKWLEEKGFFHLTSLDMSRMAQDTESRQLMRLFCRDVAVEYLNLLATRLPDSLPVYLYLDTSLLSISPVMELQLLNPERFERFHLALKGQQLPFQALGWGMPTHQGYSGWTQSELPVAETVSIGICVPPLSFYDLKNYKGLEEGIALLRENSLPFKLIAENHLTSQWDGLDYLLYSPSGLSPQGRRKLQGFCAAGGTVVSTDALQGFSFELSLQDLLSQV